MIVNKSNKYAVLKFILICLFLTGSTYFEATAQLGDGCYVGGILYTTNTSRGNGYYYRSPNLNSACGFVKTGSNLATCRLYNIGNLNNNSSYTAYSNSYSSNWREITCPIDSEVWVLLFVVGGFSIFRLKSFLKV